MRPEQAFGSVLRDLRHKKALSQEKLALEANMERAYISMLERGLRQPTLSTILKLSPVLGVSAATMVELVEKLIAAESDVNP
ncbi:helix-turn-helix transcriptional regulator [Geomonas sp. RF6]|uniref:helix-turn-helix domain-containing protein n=1 Tax=Geomonas sp. RF6 TaxID=2897342 RepID=UPI001E534206|nr:helix-turn-helix transcriptional regulator [Geomonas sp. RF6]UFS72486.1 helix-turn-helix transcriptional regulator [Geomonas sp. RF6]